MKEILSYMLLKKKIKFNHKYEKENGKEIKICFKFNDCRNLYSKNIPDMSLTLDVLNEDKSNDCKLQEKNIEHISLILDVLNEDKSIYQILTSIEHKVCIF